MKTNPTSVLFAAVTALLAVYSPLSRAGTVMLDPGHGGPDAGVTVEQAKESEIMLSFAKVLDAELKRKGYVTYLTSSRGATSRASPARTTGSFRRKGGR